VLYPTERTSKVCSHFADGPTPGKAGVCAGSSLLTSSGQTRERIPSNAWAKKIAAPTKPITAVIVSNIANVLYATARQKTVATLHSQKDFRAPTHNPDRPRSLRNRRASSCDRAPRIWDFAPDPQRQWTWPPNYEKAGRCFCRSADLKKGIGPVVGPAHSCRPRR
jgi:hypothetical protein